MGRFLRVSVSTISLAAAFVLPSVAVANDILEAQIVPTPGSPVALTHCSFDLSLFGTAELTNDVMNRSSGFMIGYTVRWYAYDHVGALMGQEDKSFPSQTDLAPGDTASNGGLLDNYSEPMSALSTMRCRMQSVKFESGRSWEYGRAPWHGPLSPMPSAKLSKPTGHVSERSSEPTDDNQASMPSNVAFSVANAWNDSNSSGTIVHVSLEIRGGAREYTLRSSDVSVKLALANGAKKVYIAMAQAAPSYQKINALTNQMVATAEVDPKSDLGNLGSILVPPNGSVRVTASFLVEDALANPSENRDVSIR